MLVSKIPALDSADGELPLANLSLPYSPRQVPYEPPRHAFAPPGFKSAFQARPVALPTKPPCFQKGHAEHIGYRCSYSAPTFCLVSHDAQVALQLPHAGVHALLRGQPRHPPSSRLTPLQATSKDDHPHVGVVVVGIPTSMGSILPTSNTTSSIQGQRTSLSNSRHAYTPLPPRSK